MSNFIHISIKSVLLILLIWSWNKNVNGQQPHFKNYTIENGLPSSTVYNVFQDSKGYIWFPTDAGVSRYDGYEFTNFSTEDGLSDNEVFKIQEDSKGRLWFFTLNGCPSFFDQDEHKFHNPSNDSTLKNACLDHFILAYAEAENGDVYFGSAKGGMVRLSDKTAQLGNCYRWIYHLWLEDNELFSINTYGVTKHDDLLNITDTLSNFNFLDIPRIIEHGENSFRLGVGSNIYDYVKGSREVTHVHAFDSGTFIQNIYQQKNGGLWVATRNGVYAQNQSDQRSDTLSFSKYLPKRTISSIMEDREGNIWITTLDRGVYLTSSSNFYSYSETKIGPMKVKTLEKDEENNLWVAGEKNRCFKINQTNQKIQTVSLFGKKQLGVSDINATSKNKTWIATKENVILEENGKQKYLPFWANRAFLDQYKNLWLGLTVVIKIPEAEWKSRLISKGVKPWPYIKNDEPIIEDNTKLKFRTNAMCEDQSGKIWAATERGLFTYEHAQDQFQLVPGFESKIADLHYIKQEDLLLVSSQVGFYVFQNDRLIHSFSKTNGLPSNICFTAKKDTATGIIWLATSAGVVKIAADYSQLSVIQDRRLKNLKINDIEIIDHNIYLGTESGLFTFDYSEYEQDLLTPPLLYLNAIFINGKVHRTQNDLKLNYNQNNVSVTFQGLYYKDPEKLKYQYKLARAEKWESTESRTVNFSELPSGNYALQVRVAYPGGNNNGLIFSKTKTLRFLIDAPYWKTWWFIASMLLVLVVALFSIWMVRIRVLRSQFKLERNKLEMERNLIEMEQKALRLQMNPHFIFNALNSIKGDYAENNIRRANKYIIKFSKFLRMVLESTDQFVSLETEVTMLSLYMDLTLVRYPDKFEYHFKTEATIDPNETSILTMLLQPFVENAIIHGILPKKEKGLIQIEFKTDENGALICMVEDNGIGRKASKFQKTHGYESKAIKITEERLQLIALQAGTSGALKMEDLEDDQGNATGTRVTIHTPFINFDQTR